MDEALLRDEVDDAVLLGNLHGHREIVRRLWREIDIDRLLSERRVGRLVVNLNDMKLSKRYRLLCSGRVQRYEHTFAPVAVRTEKVKTLVGFWHPSILSSANAAA